MTPSTPKQAASDGVVMPRMMKPTTITTISAMGRRFTQMLLIFSAAVVRGTS